MSSPEIPTATSIVNTFRILHRSPQLCACCQAIPWPSVPFRGPHEYKRIPHHETITLLQDSADKGCILCQFLWSRIMNDAEMTERVAELLFGASLEIIYCTITEHVQMIIDVKRGGELLIPRHHVTFSPSVPNEIESRTRQIKRFVGMNLNPDLDNLVRQQIRPWMDSCCKQEEGHEHCSPLHTAGVLPKRLIDVSGSQNDLIKLVEMLPGTLITEKHYLILSYCWGKGNVDARTTKDNINQRRLGFALTSLTKTIRDAISVTRLMGLQFLWIDAVCIVQSSGETDLGEFEEEAPKMRDYYANAACCVCASLASDSSEGYLKERSNARYPIRPITLSLSTSSGKQSQSVTLETEGVESWQLAKIFLHSPLMDRGWCLQELVLSRRILHWTKRGLFLKCRSSLFLEGSLERWNFPTSELYENPRNFMPNPDSGTVTSASWYKLLAFFSERQLSFFSDRLYAIQGIASLFSQHLRSGHVNGVLRSYLAQGLAWHYAPQPQVGLPIPKEQRAPRQAHFPTWCWASTGPVSFIEITSDSLAIHEDHSRRTSQYGIPPSNASLGQAQDSRLFLKAPLITIKIYDGDTVKIRDLRHDCDFEDRYLYIPDNELGVEPSSITHPLHGICTADWKRRITVQWLLLGKRKDEGAQCGLLVEEVSDEEKGTYRRYGFLELHWRTSTPIEDCYSELTDVTLI